MSMAARITRRVPVAKKRESRFFVGMLVSFYGQLLGSGGSTRMYVIGPVMFTPQEVIWYSA